MLLSTCVICYTIQKASPHVNSFLNGNPELILLAHSNVIFLQFYAKAVACIPVVLVSYSESVGDRTPNAMFGLGPGCRLLLRFPHNAVTLVNIVLGIKNVP